MLLPGAFEAERAARVIEREEARALKEAEEEGKAYKGK